MKKNYFIGWVFIFISTTSCVSNKMLVSDVKPNEIEELSYFEPQSYIKFIKKGNKPEFSDSLSNITQKGINQIFTKYKSQLHLTKKIEISDDSLNNRVKNEILYLIQLAHYNRKIKGLKLTPAIDSIMESNNQRFAISIVAVGFGRDKGNYGGQIAKGIGVGILTLGMYTPVPVKSDLTLYGIIFDSKKDEISFYKNTKPLEKSPIDIQTIDKQFHNLFKGYFFEN